MADVIGAVSVFIETEDKAFVETIRQRYSHYGPTESLNKNTAVYHIRKLLEQYDALTKAKGR